MIDVYLLRLRYEILNVPLADLAKEVSIPLSILEKEAKNWKQWWPDTDPLALSSAPSSDPPTEPSLDTDLYGDEELLSPLEEGAELFIKETRIRLQVFNLAKDVHLSHKYASFESQLMNKAKGLIGSVATPQDMTPLANLLKHLQTRSGAQLAISKTEDGLPTVIIRDLTGREG